MKITVLHMVTAFVLLQVAIRISEAQDGAASCKALQVPTVAQQFSLLPEAPTQIVSAVVLPAGNGLPERCDVRGYITTHVRFAVQMPLQGWNGKLLFSGCGGFCGSINGFDTTGLSSVASTRVSIALSRGYAVTTTDMGHTGIGVDGKWAYDNVPGKIDFAYRATHVTAIAAKAIVAFYYGHPHKYAYFEGCSTGGRQGFIEAQRWPDDFDGIIAGAGPLYYTTSGFQLLWSALATVDANRKPILGKEQVELLHKAVLDKCDSIDGVKDGIIDDPRKCQFDPAALLCKSGSTASCLSDAQVEAVRKIYQGPVNSKGQPIHIGAPLPGSELSWIGEFTGTDTVPPGYLEFPGDKFRYMMFFEDPGPNWKVSEIDWDRDPGRAADMGVLYSATNPDLRKLAASGHKLLAFQGWQDEQVIPNNMVDYYETAEKTNGGKEAMDNYYRLFMVPGMNHCVGGPGADTIDFLTYLEDWVEKNHAPDVLIGKHIEGGKVVFSRPLPEYPATAAYKGTGDINDASNWTVTHNPR